MYTRLMVLLFAFASANGGGHEDKFQSDKVTSQQMLDQDVTGEPLLLSSYSEFDAHQSYGQYNFRWNLPDQDGIVNREPICYNSDTKSCEHFERTVARKVDSCGRVEENADGKNQQLDSRVQGLPWQLISADLKNNFDMEISKNLFSWKGAECGFDPDFNGKRITTNGVEEQSASFIGIVCVVAISILF